MTHWTAFTDFLDQELVVVVVLLLVLVLVFVGATSSKRPKSPSFQIGSGWNLAGLFFKYTSIDGVQIFDMTSYFQDGSHDIISCFLPRDASAERGLWDCMSSVCPSVTFRYRDHIRWNSSKIISPPNSDKVVCNVAILAQSSAYFALTCNFQGTHILGASRGGPCDSVVSC